LLRNFADHLCSAIHRVGQQANSSIRAGRFKIVRPPSWARWSFSWLRLRGWTVSHSGKDGTCCLIVAEELGSLVESQLRASSHRHLSQSQYEAEHRSRLKQAYPLATRTQQVGVRLENLQLIQWARKVRTSIPSQPAAMLTNIGWTTETRNPVISCRLLHLSRKHAFDCFSALVVKWLSPLLPNLEHLATSTDEVQCRLAGIRCGPKTVLMKIDVAKFFLNGSHHDLVSALGASFHGPR
jgi:hypothetical protein